MLKLLLKTLKKKIKSYTILKDINNNITKSITVNGYTKDIKNHYYIEKSLIPLHCKYCDYKTGKFGCLYNHINKDYYDKIHQPEQHLYLEILEHLHLDFKK